MHIDSCKNVLMYYSVYGHHTVVGEKRSPAVIYVYSAATTHATYISLPVFSMAQSYCYYYKEEYPVYIMYYVCVYAV